jgi:hypothetical protein
LAFAKAHRHPELPDKMIWQVFEEGRSKLVPVPGRFDGFHATQASVSKCLVRFDRAVGRPLSRFTPTPTGCVRLLLTEAI